MPRGQFDALRLDLVNGERIHVFGRPELFEARGDFRLRALSIERFGLGDHLAALERLKRKLAAEGLFAAERKRPLPRFPRRIGLVTGNDAAAKRDVLTSISARFPPARILVAETYVQGPRAAPAIIEALRELCDAPEIDVVILARGGGSFEDLLPFSDERLVRAVATCPVPVVSAVGHEQDSPLSDLAADARASTPTAAARLVVPDLAELLAGLARSRAALAGGTRRTLEREQRAASRRRTSAYAERRFCSLERRRAALEQAAGRLRALSPRATLERGYAIVRSQGEIAASTRRAWPPATGSTSSSARAVSARGSKRRDERRARLRGRPTGAGRDRPAARERPGHLDEAIALWERGEELYRLCCGEARLGRRAGSTSSRAASKPSSPRHSCRSLLRISAVTAPPELVQQVPLFADLDKKELQALASSMKERTFDPGDTIASEGQTGVGFFLIEEGEATVTIGGDERGTLKAGDHFGEVALIDDGARTATVTAKTPLKVYGITAWEFKPMVEAERRPRLEAPSGDGEAATRRRAPRRLAPSPARRDQLRPARARSATRRSRHRPVAPRTRPPKRAHGTPSSAHTRTTSPAALPSNVERSTTPSPVTTRSAPRAASRNPTCSSTSSAPDTSSALRAASAAPIPPAAPAPGRSA